MAATTILYTRQFSDHDAELQQGQIVGFWDPATAVLFGHQLNAFGTAQVALAQVVYTGTGSGTVHYINSAYATLELPDQNDSGGGAYGNPVPARHVAFCPITPTVAVLVSAVMQHSSDGPWAPTIGIRSYVYYHVLRRASATATSFTLSAGWLAATTWHYPGDTGDHGSSAVILAGIAGAPHAAGAVGLITDWPQPTDKANTIGTIVVHDDDSIDVHWTGATDTSGGFGRAAGIAAQAPLFIDGSLALIGPGGVTGVGSPLHTTGAGRPQYVGPVTVDSSSIVTAARIGWGSFTGGSLQFNSFGVGTAAPAYGAPVTVPITGVPIVAVDVLPGSTRLDYVQVTLTMSNAVQGEMETGSGSAYIYGAVVDFRKTPVLRSAWTPLGVYTYGSQPSKVIAVVNDVTDTSITLAWSAASGGTGQGPNRYDVFSGEVLLGNTVATVFLHSGLSTGSGHTYQIVAVDPAGNRGEASDPISATTTSPDSGPDTIPPTTPTLVIGGGDDHSVLLQASATDNVALAGFRIFDVTGGDLHQIIGAGPDGHTTLDWHVLSPVSHNPYWLLDDTEHAFQAQAYDLAGNISGYSNTVHATLLSVPHPSETAVSVSSLGPTSITLSIVQSSELGGTDTVVIDIYRNGTLLATVPGDTTTYTDTFALHATPTYSVQARDSAGWTSTMSLPVPNWA